MAKRKGKGLSIKKKSKLNSTNQHKHSIPYLINSIIEQGDLILEILDARFIEKTRNFEIEKKAKELGKKIVYVLNKSDLVDVAEIKLNLELNEIKPYIFFSAKNKNGLSDLKEIIRKMSNNLDTDAMNVGIIGYPNTGKSSIINILTGRAATKTSSQAGFTKGLQKIRIFPGVYLMDTPGIIPLKEDSTKNRRDLIKHAEIGVRTWDKTKNPDMVVHKIMQEYPGILEKYYKIKAGGDSEILIEKNLVVEYLACLVV